MEEPKPEGAAGLNAFLTKMALGPLADAPAEIRTKLLATITPRPLTMLIFSSGLISTCVVAALVTGQIWARVWLAVMLLIIAWRALLPLLHVSFDHFTAIVIITTVVMFAAIGIGCALSFASGDRILSCTAAGTVLGSAAGLASRWGAIPRLAIFTITITGLPLGIAMILPADMTMLLAGQLVIVLVSIGMMTVQNHATLVRMIRSEHAQQKLARTDSLTGLANRAHLEERLALMCQSLRDDDAKGFALLYVDLDGFKSVNDRYGHTAGDGLLRDVGRDLRLATRTGDTLARVGGDEFIIVLDAVTEDDAIAIARRILHHLTRDYLLETGDRASIGCSIGIALAPRHGRSAATLIASADKALYSVKHGEKGSCAVCGEDEEPAAAA